MNYNQGTLLKTSIKFTYKGIQKVIVLFYREKIDMFSLFLIMVKLIQNLFNESLIWYIAYAVNLFIFTVSI